MMGIGTQMNLKAASLLGQMSLEVKIGQLNQIMYNGKNFEEVLAQVKTGQVGSLIFAASAHAGNEPREGIGSIEHINALQKAAIESCGIPLIFGRDVIHGHQVVYPIPLAMAATFHPELIQKCYEKIGEEAADDGVHWSFAPMMDVSRDPRWGRSVEGSGEDPYLASQMAVASIKGFQGEDHAKRESIAACAKHFVGYGASEGGRDYNPTEIGETTLRNFHLRPFKAAAENGVATVMSAFNAISGVPMSSNRYLFEDVLRKEFGFEGFVVSDWDAVTMLQVFGTAEDRKDCARQCLNAGIDMDMVDGCYLDHVKELIQEGKITMETLDRAVERILRVKLEYGIFDHPYVEQKGFDLQQHMELAVKAAEESMVLLKNNNNLLPLSGQQKIAAVGPMLHAKRDLLGTWTKDFILSYVKTIREALEQSGGDIVFSDTALQDSMVMAGRKRDVTLVFIGESAAVTGEARSLANIDIPAEQVELVKRLHATGQKVVAVCCFGRAVALQAIEPYCEAILYAWHSGTGMAQAVTNLLFGDAVPSGCLPMTLLRSTGQIPLYYNMPRAGRDADAYYGADYNCYEDIDATPMYPFGYGLSYTSFCYGNPVIEKSATIEELMADGKIVVSTQVSNTGDRDAWDTVQCYVKDVHASIARPLRELKGFRKVFLRAGECRKVSFELGMDELGYYNMQNKFVVEPGLFEIFVGKSAFTESSNTFLLEE